MKKVVVIVSLVLFGCSLFGCARLSREQIGPVPKKIPREVIEELAKDLAELHKIIIELNEELKELSPEERKKFNKEFKEKLEKSGLPIVIKE